jgi:hypothetical protein
MDMSQLLDELVASSKTLDYSWIKPGYIREFNVGDTTLIIEVVSKVRLCPNKALKVVDLAVSVSEPGEESQVENYTWELLQLQSFVDEVEFLVG